MSWSDVAGKFVDWLKNPSALGIVALTLIFAFLIYIVPVGVLTWINWDGTNRIVASITELRTALQQRIAYQHP